MTILEIKALVRFRDGMRCTECGLSNEGSLERFGRSLDVHRLTPGNPYTVEGCVTLCRACHMPKPKSKWRRPIPDGKNLRFLSTRPWADRVRYAAALKAISAVQYIRMVVSERMDLDGVPRDTDTPTPKARRRPKSS